MTPTLLDELKLESEYRNVAKEKFLKALEVRVNNGNASETAMGKGLINHLYDNLATNMNIFMEYNLQPKPGVKPVYYQLLKWLNEVYTGKEDELIALLCLSTLTHTLNSVLINDPKKSYLTTLASRISSNIVAEANVELFLSKCDKKSFKAMTTGLDKRNSDYYRMYYASQMMEKENWKPVVWNPKEITLLGGKLIDVLLASTDLFELYESFTAKGNDLTKVIPTQALLDTWKVNRNNLLNYAHSFCPMIIEPKDWTSYTHGGYYGEWNGNSFLDRKREG